MAINTNNMETGMIDRAILLQQKSSLVEARNTSLRVSPTISYLVS
jgi:hypothetical protein